MLMINSYELKMNILEIVLIITLFSALFVPSIFTRTVISIFLLIYTLITVLIIKKKDKAVTYKRQVIIQMLGFGIIYIIVYYMLGIYFGFYKNYAKLELSRITTYVIPFTIIIISSEILRYQLINQKSEMSKLLTFISMVLIDIAIYWQIYDISKLEDFFTLVGLIGFASVSCNLLYNYISVRFGYKPLIIYRLITIVSLYVIPIVPDVYTFLRATLRIIYPYIIYLALDYMYSKEKKVTTYVSKAKKIANTVIMCIVSTFIVMLVSCKFYIGIISVASGSMTGAINKGDAVVFIKHTNQRINEGDVIIFEKDNVTFVHRVTNIVDNNNEVRYYTKGDANQIEDEGYITNNNIIGITKFRIRYIGYPTIWIREVFS